MSKSHNVIARWTLVASAILFGLYLVNVVIGKASALLGASEPMSAGDVPEFLTLFAASICFVIGTLSKEIQANDRDFKKSSS
jgi:heme A synthase